MTVLATRQEPPRSLYQAFLRTALRDPSGVAWLEPTQDSWQEWSWSRLLDAVHRAAAHLQDAGVAPGDRIGNRSPNGLEWMLLDLACAALGAIHAPLDPRLPASAARRCLQQLRPRLVFCPPNEIDGIEGAPSNPWPVRPIDELTTVSTQPRARQLDAWEQRNRYEETACILMTSGTTAQPRGVMLSHRNLLANAAAKLEAMPQSASDLRVNLLPFAHAYARTCELTAWWLAGGTMVCAQGWEGTLRTARALRPTLINAVPSFYERCLQSFHGDLVALRAGLGSSLRRLASGGAPLSSAVLEAFATAGLPLFQGYGLTEASPVVCSNRDAPLPHCRVLDGVGPPVSGVQIRVDGDRHLWVRGEGIMQGYWEEPAATQQRIVDGWLDTRDLVGASAANGPSTEEAWEGEVPLHLEGRADDVQVLSNGCKFSPGPLERLIERLPEIDRCIVIGNGRRRPAVVVQLHPSEGEISPKWLLGKVQELLSDAPAYAVPELLVVDPESWTRDNGLLHWKGGIHRLGLERRWSTSAGS